MMDPKILNSIGLILDIAGAIMLLFFGAPTKGVTYGRTFKDAKLEKLGVGLLILGFALQLLSNFLR